MLHLQCTHCQSMSCLAKSAGVLCVMLLVISDTIVQTKKQIMVIKMVLMNPVYQWNNELNIKHGDHRIYKTVYITGMKTNALIDRLWCEFVP